MKIEKKYNILVFELRPIKGMDPFRIQQNMQYSTSHKSIFRCLGLTLSSSNSLSILGTQDGFTHDKIHVLSSYAKIVSKKIHAAQGYV